MRARHALLVFLLPFGIVGSCTNDFEKFDVTEGGDETSSGSGGKGGSAGTSNGGSGATAGTILSGAGGTIGVGGTSGAGRGGTGVTGGTTGEAGAAGREGCASDEKECGGSCVPLTDPATGCGAADTCDPCDLDHATAACAASECGVGRCDSGWGNCNTVAADGCEQTLDNTIVHCGACNRACGARGVASLECNGGLCDSSCTPGSANCTMPSTGTDDGCETSTASDARRCGGCNNDCTAQGLNVCSGGLCGCGSQGQCGNGSGVNCIGGFCSCDATTCRPGERCRQAGPDRLCACNAGAACGADQVCCQTPTGCTDVQTSATSCGACGHACTAGFICSAGHCACDGDEDCDAGTPEAATGAGGEGGGPPTGPACVSGTCTCGSTVCAEGQRCLDGGGCG